VVVVVVVIAAVEPEESVGTSPPVSHNRRGLLTKSNDDAITDPTFGITLAPAPQLDNDHTVFGTVLEGREGG